RMAFGQHARKLFAHPLARDDSDLFREVPDRRKRSGIDLILESRRKSHCTQHSQFVLTEASSRVANRSNDSGIEVLASTDKIKNLAAQWVQQHPVDGKVPPCNILLWRFTEANLVGMPAIGIPDIAAEGRHFDSARFCRAFV